MQQVDIEIKERTVDSLEQKDQAAEIERTSWFHSRGACCSGCNHDATLSKIPIVGKWIAQKLKLGC